jgi:hypothetical protein
MLRNFNSLRHVFIAVKYEMKREIYCIDRINYGKREREEFLTFIVKVNFSRSFLPNTDGLAFP